MRLTLTILWAGLWLGCGQSNAPSQEQDLSTVNGDILTIMADALVYDETAERSYQVGESIPYSGNVVWFHENGILQQETRYEDGREHGPTIWWHEDGSRAGQSVHVNGVLSGPLIQWHPGGTAKELQVMYENGRQVGREIWWHPNGREQSITPYIEGNRDGTAMGWFEDGSKSWEATWIKDEPQGLYMEWYTSGQLKSVKAYAEGVQHGLETWYYEQGEKSYEAQWVQGEKQGLLTEWYENGSKMSETPYEKGLKSGTAVGWYETGGKAFETVYYSDEEVAIQEWTEAGAAIPIPPVPAGRVRPWSGGEIEKFYKDRTRDIIYIAFGEPDISGGNTWRYDGVPVDGKLCSVLFTFAGKIVTVIAVTMPDES